MKIYQNKISQTKQNSFWYEGLIAENKGWSLYANGEQKFVQYDKNGDYLGMYDGKFRDGFDKIETDDEVAKLFDREDIFVDMNNWFEMVNDKTGESEVLDGNYDEVIKTFSKI